MKVCNSWVGTPRVKRFIINGNVAFVVTFMKALNHQRCALFAEQDQMNLNRSSKENQYCFISYRAKDYMVVQ